MALVLVAASAGAQELTPRAYAPNPVGGILQGEPTEFSGSGWGDLRGKLTVNVLGGPALKPREFAALRPDTVLGVSVEVIAPTGNAGAHGGLRQLRH